MPVMTIRSLSVAGRVIRRRMGVARGERSRDDESMKIPLFAGGDKIPPPFCKPQETRKLVTRITRWCQIRDRGPCGLRFAAN